MHYCGKKLLILKAGNSNKEKFKSSKAPKVHIFQALSKKTFELTSYTVQSKAKKPKKNMPVDHACILSSRRPNKNSPVKFFNF